jgi:DNA-binding NarL/FixJ family response regulator
VDDDVDMLSFLAEMLSRTFTVITAASGAEAVTLIEDGLRPRVIVSDVMMEPMDGFALRERISGMDACAGVPFLFLSARADPEVRKSGLSAGAVDYILKPFSVEELVAKIASLASLSQAERERLERKVVEALRAQDAPPSPAGVDWRVRAREMGMTQRDLEVLDLVIRGMSDKEIAYELACSPRTISNRISALLKKTATPSRVALIALLTRRA